MMPKYIVVIEPPYAGPLSMEEFKTLDEAEARVEYLWERVKKSDIRDKARGFYVTVAKVIKEELIDDKATC